MKRHEYTMRYVARVVIEFTTPFHVGSGTVSDDEMVDMAVVTDANGLAAIPGDSIAGVLRAAWQRARGNEWASAADLFGAGPENDDEEHGSRLDVSWGYIHDSENRPVTTILDRERLDRDRILSSAMAPDIREHCRISHRGAALKHGLFNEYAVCPGHRYTFELHLSGAAKEELTIWKPLLHLLHAPWLRLGGKSRRGFGAFTVISVNQRKFNLAKRKDFQDYRALHPDLARPEPGLHAFKFEPKFKIQDPGLTITLPLVPTAYWMFGRGEDENSDGKPADMAPVRGQRVFWQDNRAILKTVPLIPGSAVKGPIAHRTAFHYNQLQGIFADELAKNCPNTRKGVMEADAILGPHATAERNRAVLELFGHAKNSAGQGGPTGSRGRVIIDDIFLDQEPPSSMVAHAPIDRFTSGTFNLFHERPFCRGHIPAITLFIAEPEEISPDSLKALKRALRDLCLGRLPLGGGTGRGLGRFTAPDYEKHLLPLTRCIEATGHDKTN